MKYIKLTDYATKSLVILFIDKIVAIVDSRNSRGYTSIWTNYGETLMVTDSYSNIMEMLSDPLSA